MALSIHCDNCGKFFKIASLDDQDSVTCTACGHVFEPQLASHVTGEDVIEVGEADIVDHTDAIGDVTASDVQSDVMTEASVVDAVPSPRPLVSPGNAAGVQRPRSNSLLFAAFAGAGAMLLVVAMVGSAWWVMAPEISQPTPETVADPGVTKSLEMPWDVADANRHLRHNKEPLELPSNAREPTKKLSTVTDQTFPRKSTEAEVRAKLERGKEHVAVSPSASRGLSEQDRARVIEEIKSATVFIRVETSTGLQSGSGFLFQRSKNWGTIVTNVHVIEPDEGKIEKITCVFFSGTKREFEVAATVSCTDERSDLAFLRAYDEKIPAPIHSARDANVYETSTVLAAGFPFGELLKTNRRNPSITITKGTVSSLRRDDFDVVSVLQIDGGINPGNSGGPVVSEDGRLVGVAVAKVQGTSIGFAIPTDVLQQTVLGRIKWISVEKTNKEIGRHQFRIRFADPNRMVKSGELIVFRRSDQSVDRPAANGAWSAAAEKLLASKPLRVATFTHDGVSNASTVLDLPSENNLMFQVRVSRRDGGEHWCPPGKLPQSLELGVATTVPLSGDEDEPEVDDNSDRKSAIAVLPTLMRDFALNLTTGDVACLDPVKHQVHLIRADSLKSADYSSCPKLSIGKDPVSIAYKRYLERDYFIAACSQSSELYLLTADSLELVDKISIGRTPMSRVMASINHADPFVYYSVGGDGDSSVGAIDLRQMTDCGVVFDGSADFAISADGRFAYRHATPSSRELESLRMVSDFSADLTTFVRTGGGIATPSACVPGPIGHVVASDTHIYSADLSDQLATLDFNPACFSRTRPVIIGISGSQLTSQRKLILRAASLNTWLSTTANVEIPPELVHLVAVAPQRERPQPNAKQVYLDARLFVDDLNQQLVYASLDKIALIPLDAFNLRDDEPMMNLSVSSADLQVGEETKVDLRTTDSKVSVEVGEMPAGMKQVVSGLSWRPQGTQIGTTTIPITLTFDDIERSAEFQVHVRQPSIRAPFVVKDFLVDPEQEFYVCWSAPKDAGQLPRQSGKKGGKGSTLSFIPLTAGSEMITTELPFGIKQAVLLGNRLALLPADEDQQIFIHHLETLEREHLLLSSFAVESIAVQDAELSLYGDGSVDIYSAESLKRLRNEVTQRKVSQPREHSRQMFVDGRLVGGVLHGWSDSQPTLILSPGQVPTLADFNSSLIDGRFLRQGNSPSSELSGPQDSQSHAAILAGPVTIPEADLRVSLENRMDVTQNSGDGREQTEQRVNLLVSGGGRSWVARVPVVRELMIPGVRPGRPVMHVSGANVLVGCGDRIYRLSASSLRDEAASEPIESEGRLSEELHFAPRQSDFMLADKTLSLSHEVLGGSPPYDVFLMTRCQGVQWNDETGEVTLSREALLPAAATVLTALVDGLDSSSVSTKLRDRAAELSDSFEQLTGRTLNGFPIAVPIHLKASDSEGTIVEIQYFVLVDIPLDEAVAVTQSGQMKDE